MKKTSIAGAFQSKSIIEIVWRGAFKVLTLFPLFFKFSTKKSLFFSGKRLLILITI